MSKKAFTTSARRAEDDDSTPQTVEFTVDGEDYTAMRPKDATIMLMVASSTDGIATSTLEATRFLDSVLPAAQARRISARLRDPKDDFDLADLFPIIQHIISEFSNRPTESQPG